MLYPGTPLGTGASGPPVTAVQARLNALGARPPLAVDGVFGPRTAAALQQFQAGAGRLSGANGIADGPTWAVLFDTGGRPASTEASTSLPPAS